MPSEYFLELEYFSSNLSIQSKKKNKNFTCKIEKKKL